MTTYYVDYVNGLDANNGLGPDASHASNKPWKTLTKLLGAAGMASGDTAYLSPAGPFREIVSMALTSPTVETKIIGDPGNVQGFKTSGGVLVTPGPVIHTAYLTNDKTAPTSTQLLASSGGNPRNFLTFEKIMWVYATGAATGLTTSTDATFRDCAFLGVHGGSQALGVTSVFGAAINLLVERCLFWKPMNGTTAIQVTLLTGTGSDYDSNCQIRNCIFTGSGIDSVRITGSGAGAQKGGGVDMRNCISVNGPLMETTGVDLLSTSIPCTVTNCIGMSGSGSLLAATSGQITENYNILYGNTTRVNVTAGGNSISDDSYASLVHFGWEQLFGARIRAFTEPMANSPFLAYGSDGGHPTTDGVGGPRPSGGQSPLSGVGSLERGNTFVKETGTVRSGSNAISITGPGYQDFQVPVDASSTTVTCYVRWDATYAGTKPQMKVLNGEEAGVTAATATATGSSGAWEQLSLNFTPTNAGIVTIRLQSNDTNGGGKTFADDFAVA
jgi:hypothetical protein